MIFFKRCLLHIACAATIFEIPFASNAQTWLKEPIIRVCESGRCDDEEHIDVSAEDLAYADKLLVDIPAKSSERDVAKRLGREAVHRSPASAIQIGRQKMTSYRATWMVDPSAQAFSGAHFDVYFADDWVFLIKWWLKGMNKRMEFMYVR